MKMRILSLMILSYLIYDYSWPGSCGLCPPLSSLPVLVFGERTKDVFIPLPHCMVLPYPDGAVYLPLEVYQPVTVHLTFIRIAIR